MDLKLKAQSSMEFLLLVGILLVVFIAFYAIMFERIDLINDEKDVLLGQDIATKVQKEILLAAKVSDGYQREFSLPQRIQGMNYSILISGKELTVITQKTEVVKTIPVVIGYIAKGPNKINNTNGIIYINYIN